MKKFVCLLLAIVLLAGMALPATAAGDGKIHFVLPEEAYASAGTVKINFYKGGVEAVSTTPAKAVKDGKLTLLGENVGETAPLPTEPGVYSYYITGEKVYSVFQLFNVTEADLAAGTKTVTLAGGTIANTGHEHARMRDSKKLNGNTQKTREMVIFTMTEEMLECFEAEPQNYDTPAFDGKHAAHQFTTQDEMVAFVNDATEKTPYLYKYVLGVTDKMQYEIPLVVATKSEIAENATMEDAAKVLRENGKPTVWLQSSIHGNEQSAAEGALVLISDLMKKPEVTALLDKINVVIVPRMMPEDSFYNTRAHVGGYDPNRDHMELKSVELEYIHDAFRRFLPEFAIDGHEMIGYSYSNASGKSSISDMALNPGQSMLTDDAVDALMMEALGKVFSEGKEKGLRINHYEKMPGTAPAVGKTFYSLYGGMSVLMEVRGIGVGRIGFERRVFCHEQGILSIMRYVAENADTVRDTVAAARSKLTESGKVYDETKVFPLKQISTQDDTCTAPYHGETYSVYTDGTVKQTNGSTDLYLFNRIEKSVSRPTGYVIAKDAPKADRIMALAEKHEFEYFELDAGTVVTAQQYCDKGTQVGLKDGADITFANGAYFFPMDQIGANLLMMYLEANNQNFGDYSGSAWNLGYLTKDEAGDYPFYRYTGNDPRSAFGPKEATTEAPVTENINLLAAGAITATVALIGAVAVVAVILKKKGEKKA